LGDNLNGQFGLNFLWKPQDFEGYVTARPTINAKESFKARAVYTQLTGIVKVVLVIVIVIAHWPQC